MLSLPRMFIAQPACFTTCKLRIAGAHDATQSTPERLQWRIDQYYGSLKLTGLSIT